MSDPVDETPRGPAADALHVGTWLSLGSPVAAELAALCGFDWVLLDLEHGCGSEAGVPEQLRALRGGPTRAVVRVAGHDAGQIGRVLDHGARGVMGARDGDRKGAKGSRSGGDRRGGASTRGAAPKGKPGRNRRDDASLDHRPRLS